MTGWAVFAFASTEYAPPNALCVTDSGPTATASLSSPDPVRTASRPAISWPSADVPIRTAAGETDSTSPASTSTSGVRKSVRSVSAR